MDGGFSLPSQAYIVKSRGTNMYCIAIINTDEEKGLPKSLGKKKLKECGMRMRILDEYTIICSKGHRMVTQKYEDKCFQGFLPKIKGNS